MFLRNQLSLHDVFACTTSFDLGSMQDVILPDPQDQSIPFSTYMWYLHDITLISRQISSTYRRDSLGLSYSHIQSQFEVARGETLMTAGRLALEPASRRRDFIRVVDIYHYGALLYATRLLEFDDPNRKELLLRSIFTSLAAMDNLREWVHHLAWPFFFAGAESHDSQERQNVVTDLYGQVSKKMGFHNFNDALLFLQEFWKGDKHDWRVLARQWEAAGRPVLPA